MKKIIIKLLFFIPVIIIIITPIIIVDPLHLFGYDHGLNTKCFYDQRLVKANILQYENPDYNAIIIGSSRTRYMGNMQIGKYKILNISLEGLGLEDFQGFMDLARDNAPDSLDCVIVALDMFGVNINRQSRNQFKTTDEYLQDSQDFSYLAGIMISPKSFKYSVKYLSNYIFNGRDAVKSWTELNVPAPPNKKWHLKRINKAFAGWEFDEKSIAILEKMKNDYKDYNIIYIVNPVSVEMLQIIEKQNRTTDFLNWLRMLAQKLDGYYNFMDITPLTTTPNKWRDISHALPDSMKQQIQSVVLNETDNPNFTFITSQNVDSILTCIQNRIDEFDYSQKGYHVKY